MYGSDTGTNEIEQMDEAFVMMQAALKTSQGVALFEFCYIFESI